MDSTVTVNLEKFIDKGLDEALIAALTKAALLVERDAKINCPADSGQLRRSITHEVDSTNLTATIGTVVEYAPYVEIGTGIYSSEGTGRLTPWTYRSEKDGQFYTTVGQQPQPFLQPAMDNNRQNIIDTFKNII